MGNRYDGTTLIPKEGGTPEDQNKALLDLLGKTNEIQKEGADALAGEVSSIMAAIAANGVGIVSDVYDAGTLARTIKFKNNMMIFLKRGSGVTGSVSSNLFGSSSGTTYYTGVNVVFPVSFTRIDFLNAGQNNGNVGYTAQAAYSSLSQCIVYLTSSGSASQTVNYSLLVLGTY